MASGAADGLRGRTGRHLASVGPTLPEPPPERRRVFDEVLDELADWSQADRPSLPRAREAAFLAVDEGLTNREIGQRMGIEKATVREYLYWTRQAIGDTGLTGRRRRQGRTALWPLFVAYQRRLGAVTGPTEVE